MNVPVDYGDMAATSDDLPVENGEGIVVLPRQRAKAAINEAWEQGHRTTQEVERVRDDGILTRARSTLGSWPRHSV